jgi:hypothetical protein
MLRAYFDSMTNVQVLLERFEGLRGHDHERLSIYAMGVVGGLPFMHAAALVTAMNSVLGKTPVTLAFTVVAAAAAFAVDLKCMTDTARVRQAHRAVQADIPDKRAKRQREAWVFVAGSCLAMASGIALMVASAPSGAA